MLSHEAFRLAEPSGRKHILDAGCGPGAFLRVANKLAGDEGTVQLSGFDMCKGLVDICACNLDGYFKPGQLPGALAEYRDGSFSHSICFSVFLYLEDEAMARQCVEELLRVTRPGGRVLIGDVSDLAKYEYSLKLRQGEAYRPAIGTGEDAASVALVKEADPDHCYLPKEMFRDICDQGGHTLTIVDDTEFPSLAESYPNAPYRYMVYITKKME